MRLAEIFETRIEEKIEPVIKVGEVQDEAKLASEISAYVVTPTIEKYVDDFLEHYTNTFRVDTTEIGVWISGYFGSGKSHLAKILALLVENRVLHGITAAKRFEARVPAVAPRVTSIRRNLGRLDQGATMVLAFNLDTLVDSKTTPLPRLLLSQYHQARGYSSNLIYAKVIEAEIDRLGKLPALHDKIAELAKRPWEDVRKNPAFYRAAFLAAAAAVAPENFSSAEKAEQTLRDAQLGELDNPQVLVRTVLDDLAARERATKRPSRILLVLDESGQWIEDDAGRLAQLQALVEEAAVRGQGRIWIVVTTHEDMGAIYQNARALQADMKKIESRFRFKWPLATENIELVLQDRIFRKKIAGRDAVGRVYDAAPGVLRGLGELANTLQRLPECERERFVTFYPFFPYQIHLIPEIVKSLRSKGGRGEQLSGSTRTLLAITQDILRAGRRKYLQLEVGEIVPFDEVYGNLSGEGEVTPDVRRELQRIEEVVPGATAQTRRVAEVLFLVREIAYIPRTIDNVARLLVESASDELPSIVNRIQTELDRLMAAKLVARIGDEYEFLTGERRTFEDEVTTVATQLRQPDLEAGLATHFVYEPKDRKNHLRSLLGFETVPFKGAEFDVRISVDGTLAMRDGDIEVRIVSPLAVLKGTKISDLEDQSLRSTEQRTLFVLSDRVPGFDQALRRYLAMSEVVGKWKGDPRKSEEARKLAEERETNDLGKIRRSIESSFKEGLKHAHVIFRGSSRAVTPRPGQTPGETLRAELSAFWPSLYPKFEKLPVRITQEQRAILDILKGERALSAEVKELKLFDASGGLDPHSPLIDGIRMFLATRQARNERTLGKQLLDEFGAPPYGWDRNAVRVGLAACVRAGVITVRIGKMPHTNPADATLQDALRNVREFERVELVLEETEVKQEVLEETRKFLMQLTGLRKIDETPAALHQAMDTFGREKLARAERVAEWAEAAAFPLPSSLAEGREALREVLDLGNPVHRVNEIHARSHDLRDGVQAIDRLTDFRDRWATAFAETRGLAAQLRAIEHRLAAVSRCQQFLGEYEAAKSDARLAEPEVWRAIQAARADAMLELETLLDGWREEARQIATEALARLPDDLARHGLPPELRDVLAAPLERFIEGLPVEREPARVAVLPDLARRRASELGEALRQEVAKRTKVPPPPPRATRRVRLSDVAMGRRVTTTEEWEEVLKKLDERVRGLLRDFDLELE